jgi:hypothetical protein
MGVRVAKRTLGMANAIQSMWYLKTACDEPVFVNIAFLDGAESQGKRDDHVAKMVVRASDGLYREERDEADASRAA